MNAEKKIILKSNLWQNHTIWHSHIPRCVHICICDGLIMNMYIDNIFLNTCCEEVSCLDQDELNVLTTAQ